MNKDTFDFSEALSSIKAGLTVQLTLNNTTRRYFLDKSGDIMCIPNSKEFLIYKVRNFHLDAVMSDNWELYEAE